MEQKEVCLVVDGISTGKYYPSQFAKMGYSSIHVRSRSIGLTQNFCPGPNDYKICLENSNDLNSLVKSLENRRIACVVPGSELGVELAEELSIALHLPSNPAGTGSRCRNKFLTGETLRENGIRSAAQGKIKNKEEAYHWIKAYGSWPIVVKPLDSAGADGFHLCQNADEVMRALDSILGANNLFGSVNREALIQEYLVGDEYIVNTVSQDASHYIQSFMIYGKREDANGRLIFETYSLLRPSECPHAEEIFEYARNVLDVLQIRQGAAHLEIVQTAKGPLLIECNARPHGHSFPEQLMQECLGQSQIELTALALLDPAIFKEKTRAPYRVRKYMMAVHLISQHEGEVEEIRFLDNIEKLPSFYLHRIFCQPGCSIKRTVDLLSSPGDVFLCSENRMQIEEDLRKIREWETRGIFLCKRCDSSRL